MSNPLLFFIFIIVIDLILKSFRDKKKVGKARQNKQQELQNDSRQKPNYTEPKTNPSRNIMSTLREEIEKERQKEITRRQGKPQVIEEKTPKIEEKQVVTKVYDDKEYRDKKRERDNRIQKSTDMEAVDTRINEPNIKEDIIRGIIFSEILSPPKSIQNQKRSM